MVQEALRCHFKDAGWKENRMHLFSFVISIFFASSSSFQTMPIILHTNLLLAFLSISLHVMSCLSSFFLVLHRFYMSFLFLLFHFSAGYSKYWHNPYVQIGVMMVLYSWSLFSKESRELQPISQYIWFNFRPLFAFLTDVKAPCYLSSRCIPRYLTSLSCRRCWLLSLGGGQVRLFMVKVITVENCL